MSEPLVQKPGALYRPSPIVSGHRAIDDVDPFIGSLKHAWMLNDVGAQTDGTGNGKDLVARNSPTRVTGKISYAQTYNTGAVCHYHAVAPAWGANNWDWALSLWIRSNVAPSSVDHYFFNVENNTGDTISIRHYIATNRFIGVMSHDSGSTQSICSANVLGAPSLTTWYHVILQYKKDATLQMWVNNVFQQGQSATGGYANGRVVVGARKWDGTQSRPVSVDAIHFWDNYELSSDERAYMYNSGAGRELV